MKVKITKRPQPKGVPFTGTGPWYWNRVGDVFEVEPATPHPVYGSVHYLTDEPQRSKGVRSYIAVQDCEPEQEEFDDPFAW